MFKVKMFASQTIYVFGGQKQDIQHRLRSTMPEGGGQ